MFKNRHTNLVDEHRPGRQHQLLTLQRDNEHVQGNQPVEIDQMSAELNASHGARKAIVPFWNKVPWSYTYIHFTLFASQIPTA
jgi:hypothetical protein